MINRERWAISALDVPQLSRCSSDFDISHPLAALISRRPCVGPTSTEVVEYGVVLRLRAWPSETTSTCRGKDRRELSRACARKEVAYALASPSVAA